MKYSLLSIVLAAEAVTAFPFVAEMPGVDSSLFGKARREANERRQQSGGNYPGGPATCPYNKNHVPAVGISAKYPYNNAKNGSKGNEKGGYVVPDPNDTDHQFIEPGPTDVRGPCPGLNAAANHGFLARDGITTFSELTDAQQNLYNVGYDLAVTLAVLGLTTTDGDFVTEKLSIGCDATNRTALVPAVSSEPGLDGHNKFEADSSLTRNDYFTHNHDNFKFNGTLFGMMTDTTKGLYNRDNMALYRYQRYQQSKAENPNFYFGPFSLLLYGASSFLYELMPGGPDYVPDYATISSFFGAQKNSDGTYSFNNQERVPYNWTNRVTPYSLSDVGTEIFAQYIEYPVLFGGNTGSGGFDVIGDFGSIKNGKLTAPSPAGVGCLLYQLVAERIPSSLNTFVTPSVEAISFALAKLAPAVGPNFGCPSPLT